MYLEQFESFEDKLMNGSNSASSNKRERIPSLKNGSNKSLVNLIEKEFQYQKLSEEQIEDTQFNHSKIFRHIEQGLKTLMLNYNLSKIIQMNLKEKISLHEQIEHLIELKQSQRRSLIQKFTGSSNQKNFKSTLSESDQKIDKEQMEKRIEEIRNQKKS